jgi:uncharacterized phage-associated protein
MVVKGKTNKKGNQKYIVLKKASTTVVVPRPLFSIVIPAWKLNPVITKKKKSTT